MFGFNELVYVAKNAEHNDSKDILLLLPKVKRFVLVSDSMPEKTVDNLSGGDVIEASPFDVYTIEVPSYTIALSFWEDNGEEIETNNILVDDTDPNSRKMYSLCKMGNHEHARVLSLPVKLEGGETDLNKKLFNDLYRLFNCYVNDFIKMLNSKNTEVFVEKALYRSNSISGKKYKSKFSDVIYIKDKKYTCSKSFIEKHGNTWLPTHKWSVRGHWRKCNNTTLGKNRAGDRCVVGMTWVNDFQKGQGELIEKIRVVR